MIGLDEARTIAHAIEDVLGGARDTGHFPAELAEPLLRSADALRLPCDRRRETARPAREPAAQPRGTAALRPRRLDGRQPAAAGAPARRARSAFPRRRSTRLLDARRRDRAPPPPPGALARRRHAARDSEQVADELDPAGGCSTSLKDAAIGMRTLPLGSITGALPRAVRDLALPRARRSS